MSSSVLYTDLSTYYDLMCADINYKEQSDFARRIHQLFGNQGKHYLDLACGTGPHVRRFLDFGYDAHGLDINQPMLAIAKQRCPEAQFTLQDMSNFKINHQLDLITCFLYSIHYNDNLDKLKKCIASAYAALKRGGVLCFNAVDKNTIDNKEGIRHSLEYNDCHFTFQSSWNYCGHGDNQVLLLSIEKKSVERTETWNDQHQMVAISFQHLQELLQPYFDVHIFEHNFDKIVPWDGSSGNAIFVAIKIQTNQ